MKPGFPLNRASLGSANQMLQLTGTGGLYLFALGAWLSTAAASIGMGLMAFACLLRLPAQRHVWRDPLVRLSLIFLLYLLPLTILAGRALPHTTGAQIEGALDLLRLGFFPMLLVAFWLDRPERVNPVLALALAGLVLRILIRLERTEIQAFLEGARAQFDMSPNALGLYAAVALLGLILLAPTLWGEGRNAAQTTLRGGIWLLCLLLVTGAVIFSQSRAAWLAVLLVYPPTLAGHFIATRHHALPGRRRHLTITLLALFILGGVLGWINRELILQRLRASTHTVGKLLEGQAPKAPSDAYSMRYLWWKFGCEKILERPFFGWGPGSVGHLFRTSHHPGIRKISKNYKDFHNLLLQVLVQVGLVGALFLATQGALVLDALRRGWRQRWLPSGTALFLMAALMIFFICSLSNLRTRDHYGQFFIALFGGLAYAVRLHGSAPSLATQGAGRP
jgi:O-antigen ligase